MRIWEIDFFRAIAIALMILFHLIVDLTDYFGYDLDYLTGFWFWIGKAAACLFILLAGISATLSSRTFRHGCIVFAWGLVLTGVTYLVAPASYIRFGILHFLGIALICWPITRHASAARLVLAAVLIGAVHLLFPVKIASSALLLPLGWTYTGFTSVDYYPLIPWYGLFLLGLVIGKTGYKKKNSLFPPPGQGAVSLSRIGRHSLFIYLIHQPILLALLYMVHYVLGKG